MLNFKVYGLNVHGQLEERAISASNEEEAYQISICSGLTVLDINVEKKVKFFLHTKPKFDLAIFSYELLSLLKAGLSLIETLETLKDRLEQGQSGFAMLSDLIGKMREGQAFSNVLKYYPDIFPPLFIASILASEQTGEIIDALERYLRYHEQMGVIKQKIVSASVYPILLLSVGFAVAIFLLCFLVPRFSSVYEGINTELPLASRLLIKWGTIANNNFSTLFIVITIFIIIFFFLFRQLNFRQLLSYILQKNYWIGKQYRLLQLSRFYRSLGLLLSGGIPVIKALQMTKGLLSYSLEIKVNQAISDIEQGKGLTYSLTQAELVTPVAIRLLGAGERNGQLADMLERISVFHDREVSKWVDKFTRLFEPILMLIIGLIIGGIVVLLYLPIFELAGNLS